MRTSYSARAIERWAALLAVLAFVCGCAVVGAADHDARGVLERGIADLDQAATADAGQRSALIAEVIESVRAEPTIAISDWLLGPLESSTPDLVLTRSHVRGRSRRARAATGIARQPARRKALDEVLAGPPFRRAISRASLLSGSCPWRCWWNGWPCMSATSFTGPLTDWEKRFRLSLMARRSPSSLSLLAIAAVVSSRLALSKWPSRGAGERD